MSEQQYSILVVDDNDLNRDMLSRRLARRGFHIETARDGFEALEAVKDKQVDLILLDIMMPGISGMDVLKELRKRFSANELPIIMATAKDQSEDMVQAFELGANDYVTKPLDFKVVLARVQAHLRNMVASRQARAPAPPPPPPPHRTDSGAVVIADKYRLDSKIGTGNFGHVYRGMHLSLQKPVAVKLLKSRVSARSTDAERFQQEGISSCRLDHPNAVQVLDFGTTPDGTAFLVMELLEGESLSEALKAQNTFSPARCADILDPICDVLAESHSLGIIHRDIKPGNIFLHRHRGREVVKVVDFGIAKLANEAAVRQNLTIEGGIIGTPAYMAPERFTGRHYDGRSDVYSLGIMLFQMLSGSLPFSGTSDPMRLAYMHVQQPPPSLISIAPGISRAIDAVIQQTLDKDYRMRPSAELFARKFRRAVEMSENADEAASPAGAAAGSHERTLLLPPD